MTSRTAELIDAARERPLTAAERAELDPADAAGSETLGLIEALGGGEQRLSAQENERIFAASMGRARRRSMPRWLPPVGFAAAASVALFLVMRPADPDTRAKGASPMLTVALAAQRPGATEARALGTMPKLEPGEALRIIVTATAPTYLALYEDAAGATPQQLWSSGDSPVPAGQRVIGPDSGAGLSLTAGRTRLVLVGRSQPIPREPFAASACPDCLIERVEVEQR